MDPIKFPQQNFEFRKPDSMTDEECGSLPCYMGQDTKGRPVIVSCWKLTPLEIQEILESGCIYMTVYGTRPYPVCLQTDSPWPNEYQRSPKISDN